MSKLQFVDFARRELQLLWVRLTLLGTKKGGGDFPKVMDTPCKAVRFGPIKAIGCCLGPTNSTFGSCRTRGLFITFGNPLRTSISVTN